MRKFVLFSFANLFKIFVFLFGPCMLINAINMLAPSLKIELNLNTYLSASIIINLLNTDPFSTIRVRG